MYVHIRVTVYAFRTSHDFFSVECGKVSGGGEDCSFGGCMGGLEAFSLLASQARIGVDFSFMYHLAPGYTPAWDVSCLHVPQCHGFALYGKG